METVFVVGAVLLVGFCVLAGYGKRRAERKYGMALQYVLNVAHELEAFPNEVACLSAAGSLLRRAGVGVHTLQTLLYDDFKKSATMSHLHDTELRKIATQVTNFSEHLYQNNVSVEEALLWAEQPVP